jgi:hypothetical protein
MGTYGVDCFLQFMSDSFVSYLNLSKELAELANIVEGARTRAYENRRDALHMFDTTLC